MSGTNRQFAIEGETEPGARLVSRGFKLVLCSLVFCTIAGAQAQNRDSSVTSASDLARENLSRVAASARDIKEILLRDPGMIVVLKRWVAQDATEHGQIVSDLDLSDDVILTRLDSDLQFRSIATAILQRYDYLLPKLNPDSESAKERQILVEERAKVLAQAQVEEIKQGRLKDERTLQNTKLCETQADVSCTIAEPSLSPTDNQEHLPSSSPASPKSPNLPRREDFAADHAQLTQTKASSNDIYSPLPLGGSGGAAGSNSIFNALTLGSGDKNADGLPSMSSRLFDNTNSTGTGRLQSDEFGPPPPGPNEVAAVVPTRSINRTPETGSLSSAPDLVRRPNPFEDIPSLYDMYVQAVTRPTVPKRFGAEVFENGTRDSQLIPMDLPAGPEYVVGPGDGLEIDLWGGVSERFYRQVDREGRVSLPDVGPVLVSGKSLGDVQQNLQQVLRTMYRDVSTEVSLSRLRTIRVYEVGDIRNSGAYDISSLSTPLNALFVAGGPTQRGSMRIVNHYRADQLVQTVDLYDLLLHGVKSGIKPLENGDTVQVPPIGPQVTVEGMVRRPAVYELRNEKNLSSVLELAGGLLPTAALRHIEVQRLVAHEKQTMLSLDIPDTGDATEIEKKLASFEIRDGDRIRIFPIASYNQDAIYLEGHVLRPGRYSYRPDMRVTDVIASYKDLLPEPDAKYAEIVRLNAPDFRPSVEQFDLEVALSNPSQAPVLQAMDTIRVFSKYDFEDAPTVSVGGDVRTPGTYRTSGQVHLIDAIHLAGGLAPDAETESAQLFRYLADGKVKVSTVSLKRALEGDPADNVALQPRDRLVVYRKADAETPVTVYLKGEVAKPGRYPLTANMQVADLIRLGGGLKPSADTQSADLTHYKWSDQSQLTGQHEQVSISAVLANDPKSNVSLHAGDVVTIRELPNWNDLGATIVVQGQVKHPGTYGIRPGERLSSVLEEAGGLQSDAYPLAAMLKRPEVRDLEERSRNDMILRVRSAQNNLSLLPDTDPKQKVAREMALQQWQATLDALSSNPPIGRVNIQISKDMNSWKNTVHDVEVKAGDTLIIPKRPGFVSVTGQVFNPTAVSYRPGKSAKWYLSQAGGPTQLANKKAVFVIRADGSVIGAKDDFLIGSSLNAELQPGDSVVVPEKALGGGIQWQNAFLAAQVASSVASTAFIALRY